MISKFEQKSSNWKKNANRGGSYFCILDIFQSVCISFWNILQSFWHNWSLFYEEMAISDLNEFLLHF